MGSSRMSSSAWTTYSTSHISGKSTSAIYSTKHLSDELNPRDVNRESCDSDVNPNSNAIIIGLDVTGSMDPVLDSMVRSVGKLFEELYSRKPVSDPHVMFMGIGDVRMNDSAPLQVTQFEADVVLIDQLRKVYLERGGGGNNSESYIFAWYFAAMHTDIDCFSKRGKKGYLFTIGDEQITPDLTAEEIERITGDKVQTGFTNTELLSMVSQRYHVFHLMVEQGNYMQHYHDNVIKSWVEVLGQRAILLTDHTKLSEVIISAIQMNEGVDKKTIVESWDGSTGVVVSTALDAMTIGKRETGEVVEFE